MGGFHLFQRSSREARDSYLAVLHEGDTPLHPLQSFHFFNKHEDQTDIDFTSFMVPTEEEINDKGKSDWLAKSLVLLQTSWFVMQCIARAIEYLPVTHLEIVTLAYAAMNFVIYIFWWNKPLNVNRPVRVFRKSGPSAMQNQVVSRAMRHSRAWEWTWEEILNVLERIYMFIAGDGTVDLSGEDREPRFWGNSTYNEQTIADLIVLGVGVCFGAIHCISWDFLFPTHTELLMWRVLCVTITAVPIYITLGILLGAWLKSMGFAIIFILPAGILYILARTVTLALAFTSLRDLPSGAYKTVHWTTFIPHV